MTQTEDLFVQLFVSHLAAQCRQPEAVLPYDGHVITDLFYCWLSRAAQIRSQIWTNSQGEYTKWEICQGECLWMSGLFENWGLITSFCSCCSGIESSKPRHHAESVANEALLLDGSPSCLLQGPIGLKLPLPSEVVGADGGTTVNALPLPIILVSRGVL